MAKTEKPLMIKLNLASKNNLSFNNSKNFRSFGNLTYPHGFTVVELLVVIVIIAILAAITAVSYAGVSQRANIASIQQQLSTNSSLLRLYNAENASYPTSLDSNYCPSTPVVDTKNCLKNLNGATMSYTGTVATFSLTISKNGQNYKITESGKIAIAEVITCPTGFIVVPGSPTYGTDDFCVMKYNAKRVGTTTTPVSTAAGTPWVNISQTTAIANSPNVAGCTGCHLLTEPEYMTIAQNVLGVASNWDNGAGVHTVGTGFIYSGHNDKAPYNALAASTDDTDGYYGTGNTTGSNQRRTLTLSNGEVIWDLSGNVYEWTNATIGANLQPGLIDEVAYVWKQWNDGSLLMNGLPANSQPASTGIAGITGWSSTQGIGQLYSNYGETGAHAFLRGGAWYSGGGAGVLYLYLGSAPSDADVSFGFRVAR